MGWLDYALTAVNPMMAGQLFGGQAALGSDLGVDAAWKWGMQRPTAPQMGQNPYMGQWNSLIGQLQKQGTPLSDQAYNNAADTSMNQAVAMSRGGSAGQARQAGMNLGQTQATLAQGYQSAKLQEEMSRRQALMQALGGAGNAWFGPNSANLQMQANSPTNFQMLTNFLSQGAQIGAMAAGGGGGAAAARAPQQWGYGPPGMPAGSNPNPYGG